jgi:hypothetical protein
MKNSKPNNQERKTAGPHPDNYSGSGGLYVSGVAQPVPQDCGKTGAERWKPALQGNQ